MNRVRVALFTDRSAAEPIRQHLLQADIPAEIHDELWLARLWFVSKDSAGVRVEVPAQLSERAVELLLAWDATEGALRAAIRCPECNSLRVDYPQFTQKSLFTNLAIGLIAEVGFVDKDYYCESCHYAWPKRRVIPRRARGHLAPNYFIEDCEQAGFRRTIDIKTGDFPAKRCSRKPPGRGISLEPKRKRFNTLKLWRRILGIAGVMLLVCSRHSLAASANPGLPGDSGGKAGVNGTVAKQSSVHSQSPTYLRDVLPILMGKCARCHSDQNGMLPNWLDYKAAFGDRWEIKRRIWNSWEGSYFKQPMPTGNSPEAQMMTEEERAIMRDWVESGAPRGVAPTYSGGQSKAERIDHGRRLFTTICAACHQPSGQGIPSRFPPLAGSDFLNGDKHRAIKVVVNGLQGEVVVNGQKFNNAMPKFPLADQDIASVLTYVYSSFGNCGKEVTPQEVSAIRMEKDGAVVGELNASTASQEKSPWE